ncbi:TetR/AcrR family transcriptional regulator [Rhodovulum sp. DZ06]|uniref:TetR/AcrR family transcriptional regulator n=1 Tax=Rhodovulum sp. DZ06 TaxID=3425126 RepID=UPI003D338B30
MHDGNPADHAPQAQADAEVQTRRPRGRPKVMPDAEQARIILENAERLFLEQGFSGATMNDIAAACRMSKRTLYRLFPSKTEMFAELVRRHRKRMVDLSEIPDDMPIAQALRRAMSADLDEGAARSRVHLLRMVMMEAERTPDIARVVQREAAGGARPELAEFLAKRAERGEIVIPDADRAAEMLIDLVYGALIRRRDGAYGWRNVEERRRNIETGIDLFLNGAIPR